MMNRSFVSINVKIILKNKLLSSLLHANACSIHIFHKCLIGLCIFRINYEFQLLKIIKNLLCEENK